LENQETNSRKSGNNQERVRRQKPDKMTFLWTSVYGVLVVEIGLLVVSLQIYKTGHRLEMIQLSFNMTMTTFHPKFPSFFSRISFI